jgi:hypothetical protein
MKANNWFTEALYGLYSLLERGEWVWNREENRSGRILPETEDIYLKELNK